MEKKCGEKIYKGGCVWGIANNILYILYICGVLYVCCLIMYYACDA